MTAPSETQMRALLHLWGVVQRHPSGRRWYPLRNTYSALMNRGWARLCGNAFEKASDDVMLTADGADLARKEEAKRKS